ncbi:helix-turn-helix domain-containing protein [Pantoea sp.]|uniref:helix-turn-helix domain-containing protein n=1 Tax=Pantoea sp. TaxID=69393 RepID=UPI0031E2323D
MKTLNEMLATLTPEQQQQVDERVSQMRLESQLYKLREQMQRTQRQQAEAMNIAQPSVAAIEARGVELKISTLKRYVEALGGELTLGVKMPGGTHVDLLV